MNKKKSCVEKHCRKKREKNRSLCSSCRYKKRKEKDLYKWSYETLKRNSKRRGIHFSLTFQQFVYFCVKTEILLGRGRTSSSYSIDREDQTRGYSINNIRKLTVSENSRLARKILRYDYLYPDSTIVHKIQSIEFDEDDPF